MSDPNLSQKSSKDFSEWRRDFLNATFGLLKGLSVHKIENDSMSRPRATFLESFQALKSLGEVESSIEICLEEGILTLVGQRLEKHFSIVEALKVVPDAMEMAMLEKLRFSKDVSEAALWKFFSGWALHVATHSKPRALTIEAPGIELVFIDPEKSSARLKSKSLMMKPGYALGHYLLLQEECRKLFEGILEGRVASQKSIRRELFEILEIGHVNPYQLVALSLIRQESDSSSVHQAVSEAIANACLSLVMTKNLEFSVKDQLNLSISALLYNVGLLSKEISSILNSEKGLSQAEYKRVVDSHSGGILRILKAQGDRPGLERLLSLFEATQAATKNSIALTLESRLLRLISSYTALTSHRPYREAYTPFEALKLLGSRAAAKSQIGLDPVLYYVFVRFMGVYPVGSCVLLNDQRKAVVYRPSGELSGRPIVKLCVEEEDRKAPTLDLGLERNLEIVRSLDPTREGVNLTGYFFD